MPFDGILYQDDEILRVLRAAQERIRKPENWCQNTLHKDGAFCARGAIAVAVGIALEDLSNSIWSNKRLITADKYLVSAVKRMGVGHDCPATLNNTTDHPTVMCMFDRAIELRLAEIMETAAA